MTVDAAVFREQNVNIAVVVVKRHVLDKPAERGKVLRGFSGKFPGHQVVLMGQDPRGRATYFGRQDITRFLSRTPLHALPFKRYRLS